MGQNTTEKLWMLAMRVWKREFLYVPGHIIPIGNHLLIRIVSEMLPRAYGDLNLCNGAKYDGKAMDFGDASLEA